MVRKDKEGGQPMTQMGMDGVSMEMMLDGSCALLCAKKVMDS